jgi:trehalose 6-phosphate phosphatase
MSNWREELKGKSMHLVLDFDGTLIPIRRDRNNTEFPKATIKALKNLENIPVTILSGRGESDLRKAFAGLPFNLVARNGLIQTPQMLSEGIRIREYLRASLQQTAIVGIDVEEKGALTTLHFRGIADRSVEKLLSKQVNETLLALNYTELWHAYVGKKVVNIEPKQASKSAFVINYLERFPTAHVLFAGDDRNDFPVFEIQHPRLMQIYIGSAFSKLPSWSSSVKTQSRIEFIQLLGKLESKLL